MLRNRRKFQGKPGKVVSCQPVCTSWQETVWWTKLNFLSLLPKSGRHQWDCKISNYYFSTFSATVKFVHVHSSIHAFERVVHRGYIVAKACASPGLSVISTLFGFVFFLCFIFLLFVFLGGVGCIPYSRKYWWSLNLAVWSRAAEIKMLADLNLAVVPYI